MVSAKLKAHELRKKTDSELKVDLNKLKEELGQLRVNQVTGGAPAKLAKIRIVRKNIARLLTVINQTQKEKKRAEFKGKKFLPRDLRSTLTRAKRKELTPEQKNKLTHRVAAKKIHPRKFALKA